MSTRVAYGVGGGSGDSAGGVGGLGGGAAGVTVATVAAGAGTAGFGAGLERMLHWAPTPARKRTTSSSGQSGVLRKTAVGSVAEATSKGSLPSRRGKGRRIGRRPG